MTEAQMLDLPRYRESDAFSPLERTALEYAEEMTRTPVDLPERVFAVLREHLDDAQIVELTAAIAWENYRSRFNHALEIESEGFSEGAVCAVPERSSAVERREHQAAPHA